MTALGDALAAVTDAAGKMAADVLFLSRPEVAELAEPRAAGRGVSSAMPQKQNPVLSVLIRSAALQSPALAAQLHLAAAKFNDERPDGAWHSEWAALRQLLRLALGAAAQLRELAEGLEVFPVAMRRNLDLAGPLLLSEAVNSAVAPLLDGTAPGRDRRPDRETAAAGRRRHNAPGPGRGAGGHLPGHCSARPSLKNCSPAPGLRSFWTRPTTSARPLTSPAASSRPTRNTPARPTEDDRATGPHLQNGASRG